MIPCQKCGHQNPLGTMFCTACGTKIEVSMADIQGSVMATAGDKKADEMFTNGVNALAVGGFILIAALIFRFVVIPAPQAPQIPAPEPLSPAQIFSPTSPEWVQPDLSKAPTLRIDDLAGGEESLMSWRRRQADFVLGGTPANLVGIANWQIEIYNSKEKNGSWKGPDPVAATGMAVLALLAYPSQPEFQKAIDDGVEFLKPLVLRPSTRRHPIAQTLGVMALVESESLTDREIASLTPTLVKGEAPKWQTIALASFPPSKRPGRIAAIRTEVDDPLWRHVLQFYSDRPVIEEVDLSVFSVEARDQAQDIDRLAWVFGSWLYGPDAALLGETLREWSNGEPPPVSPTLQQLVGDHAAISMAVLTASATLRSPVTWIGPGEK